MSDFLGVRRMRVNDQILDEVTAGRRAVQNPASQAAGSAAAHTTEGSAATRAQARIFVEVYFSAGEEK